MWERSFRRVRQDCDSHHFFQNIFQCWVPFFFKRYLSPLPPLETLEGGNMYFHTVVSGLSCGKG